MDNKNILKKSNRWVFMDINQLRARKEIFERKIQQLLIDEFSAFEEETGMSVLEIDLLFEKTTELTGKQRGSLVSVSSSVYVDNGLIVSSDHFNQYPYSSTIVNTRRPEFEEEKLMKELKGQS